jgi:transposase, IS30 family
VQSRGALKRDLTRYLRTGRAVRRPSRKVGQRKNRIPNMINIAERPAEAEDRAVPGHWESQCCCQAAARADTPSGTMR